MLNQTRRASATRVRIARRPALIEFKHRITYDPRNIEDLSGPAQLREDVLDLISRMGSSFQAPTAAQLAASGHSTRRSSTRCRLLINTYEP